MKVIVVASLFSVSLFSLGALAAPSSATKKTLLLTAFGPFMGRGVNLTTPVAQIIKKRQAELGSGVQVEVCQLPVVYDKGASSALECLARLSKKPDLMVSLGEGGCDIRVETQMINRDHSTRTADNDGQLRDNQKIISGAPETIPVTIATQMVLKAATQSQDLKVVLSQSAGSFVCNNTGYHLLTKLRDKEIPYGFIHIPHSGCTDTQKDPSKIAKILIPMLKAGLKALYRVDGVHQQ